MVRQVAHGSTGKNKQARLMRLWRIVEILSSNPQGVLVEQVASRLRVARATCYRDFGTLKAAGVNVTSKQVGVSRRYFLPEGHASPLPKPTPRQILALRLARSLLIPFEGLEILSELDELLKPSTEASVFPLSLATRGPPSSSQALSQVELALNTGRRVRFSYNSPGSDESRERTADPIALRAVDGHVYLLGFDVMKGSARTFKLVRMSEVVVLDRTATKHREIDQEAMFAHSVKAWSGDTFEVVIQIPARLSSIAGEWPLVEDQEVHDQGNGVALVRARVAGLIEAMRWVLRWGATALVVQPENLRTLIVSELSHALARYSSSQADL